jgi:hypothetical protein
VNDGTIKIERTPATTVVSGDRSPRRRRHVTARASIDSGHQFRPRHRRAVDLAVLAPFLPKQKVAQGRVDFDADATSGADTLSADDPDVAQGRWGDSVLERPSGRVTCRDDRVKVEQITLVGASGQAHVVGDHPAERRSGSRAVGQHVAREGARARRIPSSGRACRSAGLRLALEAHPA